MAAILGFRPEEAFPRYESTASKEHGDPPRFPQYSEVIIERRLIRNARADANNAQITAHCRRFSTQGVAIATD
jgi:hypothetical protein